MGIKINKEVLKQIVKEVLNYVFSIDEYGSLSVDTLESEDTVTDEIDASAETPPKIILTPPSGKRISTRNVYLGANSDAGEITVRFKNTGKIIGKVYCDHFKQIRLDSVKIDGEKDEPIEITWSGLSSGAKIFYAIRYKIISG